MKEKIIQNIKTIRESKNLTEVFVANALDMHQSTYCKKEKGENEFTLSEMLLLCNVFNVSFEKIINLDLAKIINQQNHDSAIGSIIENQYSNIEGYKLMIEQYKIEIEYLKNQIAIFMNIVSQK